MKKVYEAPVMETLRYVFSQPVATAFGEMNVGASNLIGQ